MIRFFFRGDQRKWLFALPVLGILSSLYLSVSAQRPPPSSVTELELSVHMLVNEHRRGRGLTPFTFSPEISAIARVHSEDMASGRLEFSNVGFSERRAKVSNFIVSRRVAENIAATNNGTGKAVAWAAFTRWLQTDGNRRNLEGDFDLTGIGAARAADGMYFFTQLFVRCWPYE